MSDHSDNQDDEPDPVARMNAEDERQQLELVLLDQDLDEQQEKLERLWHTDSIGMVAFGESDEWLDKRRLNDGSTT